MWCLFGFLEVHLALKETVLDLVTVMVIVGALEGVKVVRREELQQITSLHLG
jgi:hypothetical protein